MCTGLGVDPAHPRNGAAPAVDIGGDAEIHSGHHSLSPGGSELTRGRTHHQEPHPRVLIVAAALALATACSGGGQAAAPPAASAAPSAEAALATSTAPASADPTSAAPATRALAEVFPDVAASTCAPAGADYRTSTGVMPVEAYVCDYGSVVPGATASFAQWPDAAGAQQWYQHTVSIGPTVDNPSWTNQGIVQGPLWTATAQGQTVSTGLYEGLSYPWKIRTATLDESNTVYGRRTPFALRTDLGG